MITQLFSELARSSTGGWEGGQEWDGGVITYLTKGVLTGGSEQVR
jgi:hypothetical protein